MGITSWTHTSEHPDRLITLNWNCAVDDILIVQKVHVNPWINSSDGQFVDVSSEFGWTNNPKAWRCTKACTKIIVQYDLSYSSGAALWLRPTS